MPTLNWLIRESKLNNLRLITGENHILQEISSVNVLDNPDVLKWFKKDELVLTTGFPFKDSPQLQRQIIRDMKDIGCTALCLKIRRFFRNMPQELIDEAKKLDFPVIELPYFYSFSEISKIVFQQIFLEKHFQTEQKQEFLSQMINLVLQREPISSLLQHLSTFWGVPVLFTDIAYTPISLALPYKHGKDFNDLLKSLTTMLPLRMPMNMKKIMLTINEKNYFLQKFSLDNQSGFLCLLHEQNNYPTVSPDFLQNIIQLLTLSYEQNSTFHLNYENHAAFFLHFLVHQRQTNLEETKKLCAFYGFNYQKSWICLTISLQVIPENEKSMFSQMVSKLIKQLAPEEATTFICSNENLFCTFFFFTANYHRLKALHRIQDCAENLYRHIFQNNNLNLAMGISACHKKITDIRQSFEESLHALHCQEQLNISSPGSYLYQLPLHLLDSYHANITNILKQNILKPLIDFDRESHTELIHTLKIYFACNYNASQAAKALYLHRNTMINRLEKIKELLHTDFSRNEENMLIYLSLIALKLDK